MNDPIKQTQNEEKKKEGPSEPSQAIPLELSEPAAAEEVLGQSSLTEAVPGQASAVRCEDTPEKEKKGDSSGNEEQLLKSPETPGHSGLMDCAADQLDRLRLKPKRLSGAQRKKALKAKLEARGEAFDPRKWRPNKTPKSTKAAETPESGAKRSRSDGSTPQASEAVPETKRFKVGMGKAEHPTPGTSAKPKTYKDTLTTIKLAVVPQAYPEVKLTEEQKGLLQTALMGAMQPTKSGKFPKFVGSYMERGALILSCGDDDTGRWVEATVPTLAPWAEAKLVVGRKKDILRVVKIVLKTPQELANMETKAVVDMLDKQNETFNVKDWKMISTKSEPSGHTLVFLVDEAEVTAIKAADRRAYLGLWRVGIILVGDKDHAKDPTGKPAAQ